MDSCGSILIIDDNHASLGSLQSILEALGYSVDTTLTGIDGLFAVGNRNYDLILLDLILPDISGFEILDRIRESRTMAELPVIMLTAVTGTKEVVDALNRGANDYVTKPYDVSIIKSRIQTQVSLKKAEEALRLSEERYTLAAQATRDGLWDWYLDKEALFVSANWKALLGITDTDGDFDPREWMERIHPADRSFLFEKLNTLKTGKADRMEIEYRLKYSDGSYRWVLTTGITGRDKSGRAVRITGSMSDITRTKFYNSFSGLPNSVLMEDRISQLLKKQESGNVKDSCVLFLDIDRFRFINQAYGTLVGDRVLKELVSRLRGIVQSSETLAHVGRDEFLILMEDPGNAGKIAERVSDFLGVIRQPYIFTGLTEEILITASVGIALSGGSNRTAGQMISDAESAMNLAKKSGQNRYHFFQEEYAEQVRQRLSGEKDLINALNRGELVLHYQPQIRISDNSLIGFEALIRWDSPERGLVMPDQLIPLAEENGLIIPLGEWVIETVCSQLRIWLDEGYTPRRIALNLSPLQFREKNLSNSLQQVMKSYGIEPALLELEITETKAMENPMDTLNIMKVLRELGVSFSIDDFGTGYSSLSLLQKFPLSTLKIDRAFISEMMENENALTIVESIIVLARSLGFFTIAEGVETEKQLECLRAMGCGGYQGFLNSQAVDSRKATEILRSGE